MLEHELSLIRIMLRDKPEEMLKYHFSAIKFPLKGKTGLFSDNPSVVCYRVVLDKDYNFDFDTTPYLVETVLENSYQLVYKTSPKDTTGIPYIYITDLMFSKKNFLENSKTEKNFSKIENALNNIILSPDLPKYFYEFCMSLKMHKKELLNFVKKRLEKDGKDVFIHFDFYKPLGVSNWCDIPGILDLSDNLFIQQVSCKGKKKEKRDIFEYNELVKKHVLLKSFLSTITSGDESSDIQFPNFKLENKYKSFSFNDNDRRLVFYHYKFVSRALSIKFGRSLFKEQLNYYFQFIPADNKLTSEDIFEFIKHISNKFKISEVNNDLENIEDEIKNDVPDKNDLFDSFEGTICSEKITKFDIILIEEASKISSNMTEINSISRSLLLKNIKNLKDFEKSFKNDNGLKKNVSFFDCFFDLYEKDKKHKRKFFNYVLNILIGKTEKDHELSHVLVENILKKIRSSNDDFVFNTYLSFKFLKQLNGDDDMKNDFEELGELCGAIAAPISFIVGSFHSSIVGTINLRSTSIRHVKNLMATWITKITLHDGEKLKGTFKGKTFESSKVLYADDSSYHFSKACELIDNKNLEKDKFDVDSFVIGFLLSYNKSRFFWANKNIEEIKENSKL